jgi:integrase
VATSLSRAYDLRTEVRPDLPLGAVAIPERHARRGDEPPAQGLVPANPVRLIELPPRDETPRTRIASAPEAVRLLAALRPDDALPYAIASDAGLRKARDPVAALGGGRFEPALAHGREVKERSRHRAPRAARRTARAAVAQVSRSSRLSTWRTRGSGIRLVGQAGRARDFGLGGTRPPAHHASRVPTHLASMLMATGCTIKEIMVFMGHADVQTVQRYSYR